MCEVKKTRATRKVKKVTGEKARHRFANQGFRVSYRPGHTNFCPGCNRSNWFVSRLTAECAFCGCALDIEGAQSTPVTIINNRRPSAAEFIISDCRPQVIPLIPATGFKRLLEKFS